MARQSGYIVNGLDEIWRRVARSESLFMRRGSTATHHAPNFRTVAASEASEIIEDSGDQLYDKLFNSLFVKEMDDKRYSDIIRIAHIVTFEHSQVNGSLPPVLFDPVLEATEEDFPDKLQRQMYRMLLIIKQLLVYFCEYDTITRDRIVEFTFEFFNQYVAGEIETRHFNLGSLFKQLHDKFTNRDELFCLIKVKKVLKFLHISVVISAIEELRSKLKLGLEHLTKDIHSKQGWRIVIKLNDRFVEVRHVRRESVLKQQGEGNYWEIEYNVTASFDNAMKTFSAVRLALTDLQFSPNIDITLKEELQKKFFNGRFIVC